MRTSLTFAKVSGVPLKIHLNWFLTASLVTWSLAAGYFPNKNPGWETDAYWLVGSITSLLFFGSVLFHELGHSMVALREGVPVKSITLFIFGGVAHIAKEPPTAGSEFRIVVAGPLTSLFLAVTFSLIGWAGIFGPEISAAAVYLGQMNVILAAFNMLPGFPLDGGRVLRAALWKWLDDFRRATRWATNAGIGVALLFVGLGILLMVWGDLFSGGWVAFIGWYLGTAAREGYRQAEMVDPLAVNDALQRNLEARTGYKERPYASARAYSSTFILSGLAEQAGKRNLLLGKTTECPEPDHQEQDQNPEE